MSENKSYPRLPSREEREAERARLHEELQARRTRGSE